MSRAHEAMAMGKGNGKPGGNGSKSKYQPQRTAITVSWGDCDTAELCGAIASVTSVGDALLLGRSLDGGVLVLTVCAGDERIKYYARTGEEMNENLKAIIRDTGYID